MKDEFNRAAMERTHTDYIDNLKAVKGEGYATFVDKVTFALAAGDCINYSLRTGDKREQANAVMIEFITRFITTIAHECGLEPKETMSAVEDARTMMESVNNASDLPNIIV